VAVEAAGDEAAAVIVDQDGRGVGGLRGVHADRDLLGSAGDVEVFHLGERLGRKAEGGKAVDSLPAGGDLLGWRRGMAGSRRPGWRRSRRASTWGSRLVVGVAKGSLSSLVFRLVFCIVGCVGRDEDTHLLRVGGICATWCSEAVLLQIWIVGLAVAQVVLFFERGVFEVDRDGAQRGIAVAF
jgi:hypothetical protein